MNGPFKVFVRFDCPGGGDGELNLTVCNWSNDARYFRRLATYSNYLNELQDSSRARFTPGALKWVRACRNLESLKKESEMMIQLVKVRQGWIGLLAMFVSFFTLAPMVAPLLAQTTILGELTFKGASKVEKTSGVWIDGKYVGYMSELWGPKRILLIPGDHDLAVRQAGYKDFTETLTVEPKELLLVPVKMQKETNDTWPSVTAQLKVDVQPDRAAVFVDNRFLGHAGELGGAFHSMLLSPGTHRIKVELPGYQSFETDVTLVAGQKSLLKTSLAKGSIHQADALIDEPNNSGRDK